MDNQLSRTKAELNMVQLQLSRADTNLAMIHQTTSSLNKMCTDHESVWQGVGRAFVQTDVNKYVVGLEKDEKEFSENKSSLDKKKVYLETTLEKTIDNMKQIVGRK